MKNNGRQKRGKRLTIVSTQGELSPNNPAETQPTPFDPAPEPEKVAAEPPKRGRPVKKAFWDMVADVPAEDWEAKRCYIYAYLIEPFVNVRTQGEPGYLRKFFEPIDAEKILNEWGSGRYFLRMKGKTAGERGDHDIDQLTFEIINPNHPPKLPRSLWEGDERNKRWLAMLPAEKKEQTQAETLTILNSMFDMQDRIEERIRGNAEPTQTPNAILDTAERLIKLTTPKEPAKAADSVNPWEAAEKILQMRTENPMVTLLSDQLKALTTSLEKEREARHELQTKLLQTEIETLKKTLAPGEKPKTFTEQIKEMNSQKEELEKLFNVKPNGNGGADTEPAPRRGVNGTLQFWGDLIQNVVNSPMLQGVGPALLGMLMRQPAPAGMNGAPGAPQIQNPGQPGTLPPEQELIVWAQGNMIEPMISYLNDGEAGGDFADSVFDLHPKRVKALQRMTHPQLPGMAGAPVLLQMLKHSPVWQNQLAHREPAVIQFLQEFCAWIPEGEEQAAPTASATAATAATAANGGIVDNSQAPPIDFDGPESSPHSEVRP